MQEKRPDLMSLQTSVDSTNLKNIPATIDGIRNGSPPDQEVKYVQHKNGDVQIGNYEIRDDLPAIALAGDVYDGLSINGADNE